VTLVALENKERLSNNFTINRKVDLLEISIVNDCEERKSSKIGEMKTKAAQT
jgi:hypothetical protein